MLVVKTLRRLCHAWYVKKRKKGFTFIELLLAVGVMSVVAGVSVPTYRNYQIRSDLYLANDVVLQALYRARLLSQAGAEDDEWRYDIGNGIVFKGDDFDTRDTTFDEYFILPDGIDPTGITEVAFERITGVPSPDGDIVLEAITGEKILIAISPDTAISGDGAPPGQFKVLFSLIDDHDHDYDEDDDTDDDGDDDDGDDDDDNHGHGHGKGNGNHDDDDDHGHGYGHDDDDEEDVINIVFVGSGAVEYSEGEWIPLTENGAAIVDDALVFDAPGLYVRRLDGHMEIVHYDEAEPGKKTMIDATFVLNNRLITAVENGPEPYDTEQPFNGVENSGVGGDEVTVASDSGSLLFQTREAYGRDTILLYWGN